MSSQKDILRNFSIFGGVQMLSMVISVLRSKFAAIFLGTQGVGVLGLFSSVFGLITTALNMGLPLSIVRYISGTNEREVSKKLSVAEILSMAVASVAAAGCLAFATLLSVTTFGTTDYSWAFRFLAVAVLFKILTSCYTSIMQAGNLLKQIANANIIGNILGISCTIPLYYFFRIDGIVYHFMAVGAVELLVFVLFYKSQKSTSSKARLTVDEFRTEARKVLGDGFFYNLSGFLTLLSAYFVQLFISKFGGLSTLGLYVTGSTILNTYVSALFVSMGYDYLPRISGVDKTNLNSVVGTQLTMGILIILPIILWLLVFDRLIIQLLFSISFIGSMEYVEIAVLGIYFKLFSWTVGFAILSKGSRKMILSNSLYYNTAFVFLHIGGYYIYGLRGLAIAFSLYYFIHLLGNYWLVYNRLNVRIAEHYIRLYVVCLAVLVAALTLKFLLQDMVLKALLLSILSASASIWSFVNLKKFYLK